LPENFGQILALVGLALVLLNNLGRQRGRKRAPQADTAVSRWQRWSPLAAYVLILVGIMWMLTVK
jgi:hypothetical protein